MDLQSLVNTNAGSIESSYLMAFEYMTHAKYMTKAQDWYTKHVSFTNEQSDQTQDMILAMLYTTQSICKVAEAVGYITQTCDVLGLEENYSNVDFSEFIFHVSLMRRWCLSEHFNFFMGARSMAVYMLQIAKGTENAPETFDNALDNIFNQLKNDPKSDEILKSFKNPNLDNADDALIAIEFACYVKNYISKPNHQSLAGLSFMSVAVSWAFRNAIEAFLKAGQQITQINQDQAKKAHVIALFTMAHQAMAAVSDAATILNHMTKQLHGVKQD